MEPYSRLEGGSAGGANNLGPDEHQVTFLPLMDRDRKLLPVHFLMQAEVSSDLCCNFVIVVLSFSFCSYI
jgi:ubiquitin thioesterase ZRANB1